MDERVVVSARIVEILRQARSSATQILQKKKELDTLTTQIARIEAQMDDLVDVREDCQTDHEVEEIQKRINELGSPLEELEARKKSFHTEVIDHEINLPFFRQQLEDELWRALIKTGQIEPDKELRDAATNHLEENVESGSSSSSLQQELPNEQVRPCSGDEENDSKVRIKKARSLLFAAQEDLQNARMRFHYLEADCEAQRKQFESGVIPEWGDMSRTEFDREQLANKMNCTRELIEAEIAYSDAGRYAFEVGFMRADSEQSCHFLDDPDDGAWSGDRDTPVVNDKRPRFIEAWREDVLAGPLDSPARSEAGSWKAASVDFGESCSAHGDEWNKNRIVLWHSMREEQRAKMRAEGTLVLHEEAHAPRSPLSECQGLHTTPIVPLKRPAEDEVPEAGGWKQTLSSVKELYACGQAAVAKFLQP